MGNRPGKISRDAPSQGNPSAENDGDPASPLASESSSSKAPVPAQVHCTEVLIAHISSEENDVYILVQPEEMEEGRPQENFEKSSERTSVAVTSGSSEAASGILEDHNVAPDLANSTMETSVKTDVQPFGEDLVHEACQLPLPETPPTPQRKAYKTGSSAKRTSGGSVVSEDKATAELASVGTVRVAEPWKGTEDLHPSSELSKGTEVPERVQKVSCEMAPELTTDNIQEQAMGQRELVEAPSEEAPQRTAEPQPNLISADTPHRPSISMAALGDERLAEDQIVPQNYRPLSVSETEGEIPEERSVVGSWKEREALHSPKEVSTVTELQSNDQVVPRWMCLELTIENTDVHTEEPTTVQRCLDEDASPEKPVDTESHLDSALVETLGRTSVMGTAPRTKRVAEEQSILGRDLPPTVTEMEGQVSGDSSGVENTGEIPKAQSSQLKMPSTEAQDKTGVEAGDEIACPTVPNAPLEKELEHTSTTQCLSTAEERPSSDVQLLGEAEFLDGPQVHEAGPALEATLPEAHTDVQAQPPAEVTMAQSSPRAPLRAAETVKELEEANPDQPLAQGTIQQAGSPEEQLPPGAASIPGTPLWVEHEEEDAEFVDASETPKAAEVPAWSGVLEAQEKPSGKDKLMQESPVGSPKLIPEESWGDASVHTKPNFPEASKVEDSSL